MNEGGQSSTGQLIDFVIKSHAAYPKLLEASEKQKMNIFTCEHISYFPRCCTNILTVLHDILEEIRVHDGVETFTEVTKDVHFYPDLHGKFYWLYYVSSRTYP